MTVLDLQWASKDGNGIVQDPFPLNNMFLGPFRASNWVLHEVKEIQYFVGMKCEDFEE